MNYHKWARENLSAPRARAFSNALSEIDNNKWSEEYKEASRVADGIVRAHESAVSDEVLAIVTDAESKSAAIRDQIRQLTAQMDDIQNEANERVMQLRTAVYQSVEYKEAAEKASELWQRDDDAVEPLRQALIEKYSKAQAKVGA